MKRTATVAGMFSLVVLGFLTTLPGEQPLFSPDELQRVEGIDRFRGSAEARAMLARQGFVVTEEQFQQIFEAYVGGPPKFITVDSAWHTYHVLLEDGVQKLECSQAVALREFSAALLAAATEKSAAPGDVYADLADFAAVGLALQREAALEAMPVNRQATVRQVLRSIREASGPQGGVLFFGLPLMPEQFRAGGFYADDPAMRNYFAARQWYATQTFRLRADLPRHAAAEAETERAVALALLVEASPECAALYRKLNAPYDRLLGPPDDASVTEYARIARELLGDNPNPAGIAEHLQAFRNRATSLPDPRVNDQGLPTAEYRQWAEATKGFRLLPPRRLPSAVLFHQTVDPAVPGRGVPSGVDLFAAGPLVCDAGKRALRAMVGNAEQAEAIMAADPGPVPDSLHGDALKLLQMLQVPRPASAPAALRSEAWHDKQLWTALAAWAEQRHTWALHAKLSMYYFGGVRQPPGYVSPYPEFFTELGRLARETGRVLAEAPTESPNLQVAAEALLAFDRQWDQTASDPLDEEFDASMEKQRFTNAVHACRNLTSIPYWEDGRRALLESARRVASGTGATETDLTRIAVFAAEPGGGTDVLLSEFADLCDRLAAIARKHLEGKPLDEDDVELIRSYGMILGGFHFYEGNSWLTPRDDFPLVTPVFSSPVGNLGQMLYAGLGRPQAIHVILPVDGRLVLHRGAVLTYREFLRPIDQRLDDRSWTVEVQSGRIPAPPDFTRSFLRSITPEEAAAIVRAGEIYPGLSAIPGRAVTWAIIEVLREGEGEHGDWLREELAKRAGDDDVPDLLAILEATPPRGMCSIADAITHLDWTPHRAALLELLRHEEPPMVDAAAYILQSRPEQIDVTLVAVMTDFVQPRSRRMLCHLIGQAKAPGEQGLVLLHELLADADPGVRFQAAVSIAQCSRATPKLVERLTAGIDDKNEFVAAAMVHALVKLQAKEAAAPMLDRLRRGVLPPIDLRPTDAADEQYLAVTEHTRYDGCQPLMVLHASVRTGPVWRSSGTAGDRGGPSIGPLGEELIKAIVAFDHKPAAPCLRRMVFEDAESPPDRAEAAAGFAEGYAPEALEAFLALRPEGMREMLLEVLRSEDAPADAVDHTLYILAERSDPGYLRAILPRLSDRRPTPRSFAGRVDEQAASTLAQLAFHANRDSPEQAADVAATMAALRKKLTGEIAVAALVAMFRIDPENARNLALEVACNPKADVEARVRSLEVFGSEVPLDPFSRFSGPHKSDAKCVPALLPLLGDNTPTDQRLTMTHRRLTIGELAANAIAMQLQLDEAVLPKQTAAERSAVVDRIRTAARSVSAERDDRE